MDVPKISNYGLSAENLTDVFTDIFYYRLIAKTSQVKNFPIVGCSFLETPLSNLYNDYKSLPTVSNSGGGIMAYVLTQFSVEDFPKWKVVFDEFVPIRKHFSSKGARAFRVLGDPKQVVVLTEFADMDQATELYASQDFKDAIERAGVKGTETILLLEEVDRLSA